MSELLNQSAVAGHNEPPDYAKETAGQLARDYAEVANAVAAALDEARAEPAAIEDEAAHGRASALIVKMRDLSTRLKKMHDAEKLPYLRRGEGVDQFFFGLMDKVMRRAKANKAGAADVLQARVTDYLDRKLQAELAERRRVAEEEERKARAAREAAERAERERAAAEAAAARARNEQQIAAKMQVAAEKAAEASAAVAEAQAATARAADAKVDAKPRAADVVRTRFDDTGVLSTLGEEGYAEIVDSAKLDKEKLWPFITEAEKAKALRQWARSTNHLHKMDGAAIGKRPKGITR